MDKVAPAISKSGKYSFYSVRLVVFVQLCISMQGETKERWWQLCDQAAVEQDPEKLLILTHRK